ncbi:FtsW/RodA/SpoVE family cell cycle protein [Alkalibaculum sp. M08DMB]|uniref:FtsW/RodA/SpoVE family cell cycle protein n=1 Tax=Alkalibaculum sporogenes TaxID=2655001 RepID=A0A6A7K6Y0_9FIRM|nr:FtsW/RodA/SpoVE family cell cycle protein [Alkalibaculum sporogenes]MPW25145.1 FtsW/RodA/SpoVE family cell cycle protein [Alkalibaculum sporogenes]
MRTLFNNSKPITLVVLFNIMAFGLLFFRNQNVEIIYYGLTVIGIICFVYFFLQWRQWGDVYLFIIVTMLISIGLIMIFRLDEDLGIRQVMLFSGGMVLFLLSYLIFNSLKFWHKLTYFYIGSSLLLFIITLAFGRTIGGATNWISFYGISIQPSEFIKIIFIFFLASYYNTPDKLKIPPIKISDKTIEIKNNIILTIVAYGYMGFLVLQREWGGALLMFLIHITLLFVFEEDIKVILMNIAFAIVGALGGALFVYHIKVRIDVWIDPWADIAGKGYQITQSMFAIGSGGFFGRGLGLGSPKYIPEVETDFIFSAICEEFGIFGGVAIILLYFILVYRGFKIALSVENTFYKAIALGITAMFGFQTFIIIGGVIKLIPLTGITLPFISYGGSSLTTNFIALAILQAISKDAYSGMGGKYE